MLPGNVEMFKVTLSLYLYVRPYIYEITNRAYGNSLHSVARFLTRCLRSRDRNQPCHYLHGARETHTCDSL